MQALTKKRPIEDAHLLVVACPQASLASVMDFLKNSGCDVDQSMATCPEGDLASVVRFLRNGACALASRSPCEEDEPVPVEVVSPNRTPGTILRGFRCREDLTQAELSRLAGIPRHHISEMENNKRPIGKQTARKLAEVFQTDARMFIWA